LRYSTSLAAMDKLPPKQQADLKKCSDGTLRTRLIKAGRDGDDVHTLTRPELLETMAEVMLTGVVGATEAKDGDMREKELLLKEKELQLLQEKEKRRLEDRDMMYKKWEIEEQRRQEEKEAEERRRREEKELEEQRSQARWEAKMQIRQCELDRLKQADFHRAAKEGSLIGRTKKFVEAVKGVFPRMPVDSAELPVFFDSVENFFAMYEIPDDIKSKLFLPLLTEKAKAVVTRLPLAQLDDYVAVKKLLLAEFRITPRELRARFTQAARRQDETFTLFAARLNNLLTYYLRSRGAESDLEKLKELLVADKLKDMLPANALQHVLSLEGDGCFDPNTIANNADIFVSNYDSRGVYRHNSVSNISLVDGNRQPGTGGRGYKPTSMVSAGGFGMGKVSVDTKTAQSHRPWSKDMSRERRCFVCNSKAHLANMCPEKSTKREPGKVGKSNACGVALDLSIGESSSVLPGGDYSRSFEGSRGSAVSTPSDKPVECVEVPLAPLKYIDIWVNGDKHKALIDSGSEIALIDSTALGSNVTSIGNMHIQAVVGPPVVAKVVALDVTRFCDKTEVNTLVQARPVHVKFAVADLAKGHDVVLPSSLVEELMGTSQYCTQPCVASVNVISDDSLIRDSDRACNSDGPGELGDLKEYNDGVEFMNAELLFGVSNSLEESVDSKEDVDGVEFMDAEFLSSTYLGDVTPLVSSVQGEVIDDPARSGTNVLIQEQTADLTLAEPLALAKSGKGGYMFKDNFLFHTDHVLGQVVEQIVVPKSRREHVMQLAHDQCGGHLAYKKTSERIRFSFYWPSLKSDVLHYCASCLSCQQRSRQRVTDRVPIVPIPRASTMGERMTMDIIGPIDPPSAKGHKYCLCVVDSYTRWPSVYLLKDLRACSVCDALLELFSHVGVASVMTSDQGTNFTSRLTKEFLNRMGCSPRFNTPGHPEASGVVERWNQTFKRMLHHAIRENPRQWHKSVPFLTWAMRECSNATTNLPPYLLMYGRVPRGPLAILKETWMGDRELPPNLGKTEIQYLQELKENLELAGKYADSHAVGAQKRYAAAYNTRAREKQFSVGDQVMVLSPDSSNKLYSRWHGPHAIAQVNTPHSYLVDMEDGARRHIHVNKLRPYIARVNAVVCEDDVDFGRVLALPYPADKRLLPSDKVDIKCIAHLSHPRQRELLMVLDRFPSCFSEKPGHCELVQHDIVTTDGFKPRQSKPYKIPEILKVEVDRQVQVLLNEGFIQPSTSPMTSPVVCVLKPDKTGQGKRDVRLTVDYRYLNSFTQSDPFPMPEADRVLDTVMKAKYISIFDCKSGYWQTGVVASKQWLTAFTTHNGLYEWTRTPFGMKNSGATFVRMIQEVLRPISDFTVSFIDDMAVCSDQWNAHLSHVTKYLGVIQAAGITLNLQKCEFAKSEVRYVGHVAGSGKKKPDPQKLEIIKNLPVPTTQKQLRSVLGLLNYYRAFQPGYSTMAKPLTDLTSRKAPVKLVWTDKEQQAFDKLKEELCKQSELYRPRIGSRFVIRTDASGIAVAACLSQPEVETGEVNEKGTGEKPIAFCSQKLNPTQARWSTIEREAYAVIYALQKFHHLIFGAPVIVYSDHNPLSYIVDCAPKSAKLSRWALALQEYDLTFRYAKGSSNHVADCLSRFSLSPVASLEQASD
jgi:hypothetical protein